MSGDPLTIATAILTLINTLQRVISLLEDFANAEQKVVEIKRDCVLTKSLLHYLSQQLGFRRGRPTLSIDGTNSADGGIDLWDVLDDNVTQLQLDLNVLANELEALSGPYSPETPGRIGRLIARGQVTWRMSSLEAMHRKIVANRMQLNMVYISLDPHAIGSTAGRRGSDDSAVRALTDTLTLRRSSESGPLPSPSRRVQAGIVRAVGNADRHELESLLRNWSPDFHVRAERRVLSPLDIAAMQGHLAMVNILLSFNARVDCCGGGEDTPLTLAISHNHPVVALALIRRGANILLADAQERTPLHHAARQNLYAVVQVLANNGADVNAFDRAGLTPLMQAVRRNDREVQPYDTSILRVLLQERQSQVGQVVVADPTIGTLEEHYTPLHHAAARGYLSDLELMLQSSHTVSAARLVLDSAGRTPLWYAAKNGHVDTVKLLLRLGADTHINHPTRDPEFPTALWAMASSLTPSTSLEGVTTLLTSAADPNTQHPTTGQTLLHYACQTNNGPLITLLLTHAANSLLPDNQGQLPLHHATKAGHLPALTTLLAASPTPLDIDTPDHSGKTSLMLASANGHEHLLPPLIKKYSACIAHRDKSGCTAFHAACAGGHVATAAYLLGCGTEIDERNDAGDAAVNVAERSGQGGMVEWLVRMGADAGGVGR